MNFIIAWIIKKIGVSTFLMFINGLYIATVVTFFVFIIEAITFLRISIQSLFDLVSGSHILGGNASAISVMLGYLNVMGFFDALSTAIPLLSSAFVFLLMRILWKYSLFAYKSFINSVKNVYMV